MAEQLRGFEYDVALSFAGEDRQVAEAIADHLRLAGVRVFYDTWEQAGLWGKDLYQHLSEVYGKAARYSLILISKAYMSKAWTNHELRSAQVRALSERGEYILPVRLDDTELPGLPATMGYIDLRKVSTAQLAALLLQKLRSQDTVPAGPPGSSPSPPKFRVPRLPRANVDPVADAHSLIVHVEGALDARVEVLRDAGLLVRKETGPQGMRHYRVEHRGRLVYFLRMKVGGFLGEHTVAFLDGWSEPHDGESATAIAEVRRTTGEPQPIVNVTDFNLLDDGGVSVTLTFDQLSDRIWNKACRVIESIVNRTP